ncbi:MAG: hypothetical protein ACE3JP_01865 [Ectobacillus sp.]
MQPVFDAVFMILALLNLIVDFSLQADAFRGWGRAAFPAGVAAFRSKSTNESKSILAFNRAMILGEKALISRSISKQMADSSIVI